MSSSSTTSLLAFSVLLPLLLINPSRATSFRDLIGGALHGRLPSNVDVFDKVKAGRRWIPALFVFGDSLVDSGNNNFLHTIAKANYPPYGSTFFHNATGRFTDGRTAADFIAQINGLPYPPPYLEIKTECKPMPKTGVNFASGSCGILPNTGNGSAGNCLNLDKQVQLFEEVTKRLRKRFRNETDLARYLSKSVFYISIGSNDYFEFLDPTPPRGQKFTPVTFPAFLAQELSLRLKKLYDMGARKFLVSNVGAVGCTPAILNMFKPPTPCFDPANGAVSAYNAVLPGVLTKLQSELPRSKFVISNIFKLFVDIKAMPATFQISDTRNNCCVDIAGNGTLPCKPFVPPCKDVNSRLFFDVAHPTQSVHYLLVRRCLVDPTICGPLNLSQLMRA